MNFPLNLECSNIEADNLKDEGALVWGFTIPCHLWNGCDSVFISFFNLFRKLRRVEYHLCSFTNVSTGMEFSALPKKKIFCAGAGKKKKVERKLSNTEKSCYDKTTLPDWASVSQYLPCLAEHQYCNWNCATERTMLRPKLFWMFFFFSFF